jgi:plasmid stability protein
MPCALTLVPFWRHVGVVANLSIKNVPEELLEALRTRARRNHRSLQGELMAILEESVAPSRGLTPQALLAEVRRSGLATPSESVAMIREDRDGR